MEHAYLLRSFKPYPFVSLLIRLIVNGKCESEILMPVVLTQGVGYIIIESLWCHSPAMSLGLWVCTSRKGNCAD